MIFNVGSSGASSADKVKYDNSTSGLKATNVQGAVDEVNNSFGDKGKYEFLGTAIGTNSVTFNANDYNELYFDIDIDGTGVAKLFAVIPVILLSDTPRSLVASGGYQQSSYGKFCNLNVSLTSAKAAYVRNDSKDTINSVKISVYGVK